MKRKHFLVAFAALLLSIPMIADAGFGFRGGGFRSSGFSSSRSSSFSSYHSYSSPSRSVSTPSFSRPPIVQPKVQAAPIRAITPATPPKPVVLPSASKPGLKPTTKAAIGGAVVGATAAHASTSRPSSPHSTHYTKSSSNWDRSHPAAMYHASSSNWFSPNSFWFYMWIFNGHGEPEQVRASCDDPQYQDFQDCIDKRKGAQRQ